MKKQLILLFAIVALVAGARYEQDRLAQPETGPRVYFAVSEKAQPYHGPAIGSEAYVDHQSRNHLLSRVMPGPRMLVNAMLAGPEDENLVSPFPPNLSLESWRWDPEDESNLQVRFSEQYGGLADISLTIADYCVVLTLSQIPGVESVEITSGTYSAAYRSHQILRAQEAELTDPLAVPETAAEDTLA